MSDIAKWALLVAGAIMIVGLIIALPFMDFLNVGVYANMINVFVDRVGGAFTFARGLINNFLTPWGATALTGLLFWMFGKWAIMVTIKIVVWVYHFIFK